MSDPQSFWEGLRGGAPAPPVAPDDLKHVWEFYRSLLAKLPKGAETSCEGSGSCQRPAVGIDANVIAEHCRPGANASAVFFRCSMLWILLQQGLLAPWQRGGEIDELVFQVVAHYPVHLGNFDVEALMQHIREKAKG